MATPLHHPDALFALAEAEPGPARDWAQDHLAVVDPARCLDFLDDAVQEVLLATGYAGIADAVLERLAGGVSPALAANASLLGEFGLWPEDTTALRDALRGRVGIDDESDPTLLRALAQLGDARRDDIARLGADAPVQLLGPIVLKVAAGVGALDHAAKSLVDAVLATPDPTSHAAGILAALDVQVSVPWLEDDPVSVTAARFALPRPMLPAITGSLKRRSQKTVDTLLAGNEGPAATFLRAWMRADVPTEWLAIGPALATWIGGFTPSAHPIDDVVLHGGGGVRAVLGAARRALDPASPPPPGITAVGDTAADTGPVLLAAAHPSEDVDTVLAGLGILTRVPLATHVATGLRHVIGWKARDHLPDVLHQEASRGLALMLASAAPTMEVLEALLAVDVPADSYEREDYAWALASMGDHAAVPRLREVLEVAPEGVLDPVRALVQALLRITI